MININIDLEVKTCQAISCESLLHLVCISNKFNRPMFEQDIQHQLAEFQKGWAECDEDSYLGRKEKTGKKVPPMTIKLDYPFNGPWEKTKDGQDTCYKRMFVVGYATEDKVHVETLFAEFKRSGKLQEYWGEHANIHFAPLKNEDKIATTSKQKWASICDSHSCTMLCMGTVMLEEVKNPDKQVKVAYWKPKKADKVEYMSLRGILHSIKVPGGENGKEIQVFHGLCSAPSGGYEASVAS